MKTRNAVKPQPTTRNGHAVKKPTTAEGRSELLGSALAACQSKTREFTDKCSAAEDAGVDLAEVFRKKKIMEGVLPSTVRRMLARQHCEKSTIRLELDIDLGMFGLFCQGAHVLGLKDWREAAYEYLNQTVCEWAQDDGFYLPDAHYIKEVKFTAEAVA